jgi:hypothetical protein
MQRTQVLMVLMMGVAALSCGGGGGSTPGKSTNSNVGGADGGMGAGPAAGDRASSEVGLADASAEVSRDGSSDPLTAAPPEADGGPSSSLSSDESSDADAIRALEHRIAIVH